MTVDVRTKYAAAHILQSVICDAVCGSDSDVRSSARDWLLLSTEPGIDEIVDPEPGSFMGICRMLGFNWRWLRKTMRLAVVVDTIPSTESALPTPLITKKHLSLVHNSELEYNRLYEQQQQQSERNPNSDRASKTERSKCFLYLQAVPSTKDRP